jgi:periplasmic protein TonB
MSYGAYSAETRRARGIRWACAGIFAMALHAGAVLALLPRTDEAEEAAGAIAIELAPITAAPALTSPQVAPGPLRQEGAPAPDRRVQPKEKVEEIPIAPAPEPAVEVRDRQSEKKADPRADDVATAPPPVEAKPSDAPAAPAPGLSTLAKAQAAWHISLVAHINRYKRYPAEARIHKVEGVVNVEFTLDRSGQILDSRVAQSSGSAILDAEAVALLKRAAPLPTPPKDLSPEAAHLALPIQFRMN